MWLWFSSKIYLFVYPQPTVLVLFTLSFRIWWSFHFPSLCFLFLKKKKGKKKKEERRWFLFSRWEENSPKWDENAEKRLGGHKWRRGCRGRSCPVSGTAPAAGVLGDVSRWLTKVVGRQAVKWCGIRGRVSAGGLPFAGSTDAAPLCTTSAAQTAFHVTEGSEDGRRRRWGWGRLERGRLHNCASCQQIVLRGTY